MIVIRSTYRYEVEIIDRNHHSLRWILKAQTVAEQHAIDYAFSIESRQTGVRVVEIRKNLEDGAESRTEIFTNRPEVGLE